MKSYVVYNSYNHAAVIGTVELDDDIPDEVIADCVLGPEIRIGADNSLLQIEGFGMFPRVNTDIRPRE